MQYRAWYSRTYLGQVFVSVTIQGSDISALAERARRRAACRAAIARKSCRGKEGKSYEVRQRFVTSCRRPRRGSEAVAAAKAHEVLITYRDSLVQTSESDCAAVGCCTSCSATSLLKATVHLNYRLEAQ